MSTKPFVSWVGHGAVSLAPPDQFAQARSWAFAVQASIPAIQTLVDTLLNPGGGGQVRYEAILPTALFSFLDSGRSTSLADPIGWKPGRECAIWVPLLERRAGLPLGSRIVFWSPYIFINYTIGMVTGREVWGWPKSLARIGIAADHPDRPEFFCTTTLFSTLLPATPAQEAVLYRVVQQGERRSLPTAVAGPIQAGKTMLESLFGATAGRILAALEAEPTLPCIQLKQFRLASDPALACYQAIVESPIALTAFRGGGLLPGRYTVEITTCESHQIVADLLGRQPGPQSTTLEVFAAIWLEGDFMALPGREIAVRP
jgi:hypothetical protein